MEEIDTTDIWARNLKAFLSAPSHHRNLETLKVYLRLSTYYPKLNQQLKVLIMRLASSLFFVLALNLGLSYQVNAAVTQAPDLELNTRNGAVNLSDFKGRVVYLDFWASWCKPCVKSFPWMQAMHTNYQSQGLEIVAINLDKSRDLAEAFLKKVPVDFTVAFDPAGETAKSYELRGMPTSYLIGRDGKIYATHIGFRAKDKPKLELAIQQLLNQ